MNINIFTSYIALYYFMYQLVYTGKGKFDNSVINCFIWYINQLLNYK
jgi:hypothetical protein